MNTIPINDRLFPYFKTDENRNVRGLVGPDGKTSVFQSCLYDYINGETGLVVAAGAAETLFGDAIKIPAGSIKAGDLLRMVVLWHQAAASNSSARKIRIRSSATEAGLLTGGVAHQYQSTSTTNTSYLVDKSGVVLSNISGVSQAVGVGGATATTGSMLSLAFADLSADSWMQFTVENASDQAFTLYYAALYLQPSL